VSLTKSIGSWGWNMVTLMPPCESARAICGVVVGCGAGMCAGVPVVYCEVFVWWGLGEVWGKMVWMSRLLVWVVQTV
jgi:hypothetical protein